MMATDDAGQKSGEEYSIAFSIEGESVVLTQKCEEGEALESVVARLAAAHSRPEFREFLISLEDEEEPTKASVLVGQFLRAKRRGRAHLHTCHRISVTIEYNGRSLAGEFPAAATVHRVLSWAVGSNGFNIEADVHDLALQVTGTGKALEPNIHIGTLVRQGTCMLALELVAKDRPQG